MIKVYRRGLPSDPTGSEYHALTDNSEAAEKAFLRLIGHDYRTGGSAKMKIQCTFGAKLPPTDKANPWREIPVQIN